MELRLARAHTVRLTAVLCLSAATMLAVTAGDAMAAPKSHGGIVQIVKPRLKMNANQSTNWYGYNQGTLEQGSKLFNSVSGDWTVPTATQHTAGKSASSSTWIGIGRGCVDANCNVGDNTLIQTGTEQDVDAAGRASYSAWWELIPAPSIEITNMTVAAGDHMHAAISELVAGSNVWTITLQNVTRGQTFTTTVPYTSTHGTAEWIEETPLLLGTNAGFAALPNLGNPAFSNATVNGANAGLTAAEQIYLTDSNGKVIGSPSAPNAARNGFSACTWATSC